MLILVFSACSLFDRPELALKKANDAWAAGDLAAFEELVDLDAVAVQAVEGCLRLSVLDGWSERQFQPRSGWTQLGIVLEESLVQGVVELGGPEIAEQARQDFGMKSMEEVCPAFAPGDPSDMVVHRYEGGADVDVPLLLYGEGVHAVVKMQRLDSGWKVTGLSFDAAEEQYKELQETRAQARARQLLDQLSADFDRSIWLELEAYAEHHPEDPVGVQLRALVDPLVNAETPVVATEAWLQDRRLPGFRDAKARIENRSGLQVSRVTVRFELQDSAGRSLRHVDGEDALTGTLTTSLGSGDQAVFGVPGAGVLFFPDASRVQATPIAVVYEDGATWTHPAVEKGLWTR